MHISAAEKLNCVYALMMFKLMSPFIHGLQIFKEITYIKEKDCEESAQEVFNFLPIFLYV